MKYLFWNTHKKKDINPILCDLIIENGISIVILAEYSADMNELITLVGINGIIMQQIPTIGCERIYILAKNGVCIKPKLQTDKASIQVINDNIILCGVHLNSQIYSDNASKREIDIEQIVSDIINQENELNTKKTIVVGDFNINPYDDSCVSARYFHGIPIYEETLRESRIVAGKQFYMFYNPMWNFLGDFKEPFGTYYYKSADTVTSYWNIFDQVIIRPALRNQFIDENLKIITKTLNVSLVDKKKHPDHNISDHLPITFEIREENYE